MATTHSTEAGQVTVEFIHPPIPPRIFDYVAYREDEGELGVRGRGKTKEDAISESTE